MMALRQITLDYIDVLERCERDSRAEMLRYQASLLERLCRHARASVPFYSDRLDVLFDGKDRFSLERWDDVPVLTRRDLMEHSAALRSSDVPKNFGRIIKCSTSGSTGEPVRVVLTGTEMLVSACIMHRFDRWHGFDPRRRLARIVSQPLTGDAASRTWSRDHWARVYRNIDLKGPAAGLNGQLPIGDQVVWLEQQQPDYLVANPRVCLALANAYLEEGRRPGYRLRGIRTFGETGHDLINARVSEVFGVVPRSNYTSEDAGNIAVECPRSGLYHVADETMRVDIADGNGRPAQAGEPGRVLLTPLYGYAMPRIRYEVGDEACFATEGCPCDRPYTTLEPISGRVSNLFRHPDGHLFRPERDLLVRMLGYVDAMALQVAQVDERRVEVRYKPGPSAQDVADAAGLAREISQSFGYDVNVRLVSIDKVPALANGKREDFVCEITSPGAPTNG